MNTAAALAAMHPPAGSPASAWATRITMCWRATVEGVLEVGRLLERAKAGLDVASFELMIDRDLPFTASTARRLIAIGSDPRLSDRAHVHKLPNSWGTLYELTKLTDEQFADKVKDGTIRPDVERTEIVAVRKAIQNAPAQKAYQDRVDAGCTLADLHALADSGAQFGSITADPNWQYETWSDKGKDRSPDQHYKTDPLKAFIDLPVAKLAAKNSALYLWCMDWRLPDAIKLIEQWKFNLINVGFVWVKTNPGGGHFMGLGHWTRNSAELCLFATKGHPVRRNAAVRQVIEAPVGRHSEKPEEIFKRVEALTDGPYLELFARKLRENWTCWGNEIPRDSFKIPTDAAGHIVDHDDAGEVIEPPVLIPAASNEAEEINTAAATPNRETSLTPAPAEALPEPPEDIPVFLRRAADNSVPVASASSQTPNAIG